MGWGGGGGLGYMEDLYHAHDQLWTYTLEPCLTKVSLTERQRSSLTCNDMCLQTYETKLPLDITEILNRFPEVRE